MDSHTITEIKLQLPVGTIAGKWWGPLNVRPILCLHGWEDNAGTFDELIPLLPKNVSYLAIDFPGHGLSSKIGNGVFYTMFNFVHLVKGIKKHYNWDKISIMGHSLGAIIGVFFSSFFPEEIDMLICIDGIIADTFDPKDFIKENRERFDYLLIADDRNHRNLEPPSYSYEVVLEKMQNSIFKSINLNAAKILLKRGITKSEKSKDQFFFSRDGRLRVYNNLIMSKEMWTSIYENMQVPLCYIQANVRVPQKEMNFAINLLKDKPNFYHHLIDGKRHHLHLTDPESISEFITNFINKFFIVKSKL